MDFGKYDKILKGENLSQEEILHISEYAETEELLDFANRVRETYHKNKISLCAAMNLKSGKCSEDCKYCSQSAFYNTNIPVYPMQDIEKVLEFAAFNEEQGITNFELSTSGGDLSRLDKVKLISIYETLSQKTSMRLCGAHGLLKDVEEAKALKKAGLVVYQHNLQAGRSFFHNVITTHTYEQRLDTLKYAKEAGLILCSGGVIGVGETMADRLEMAFDLRDIGIASMPVNILNPIPGTPFGDKGISISKEEIFRTIALLRITLPKVVIIYGAGRLFLEEQQFKAFLSGLNGIVVGNFLTTSGACISDDIAMIHEQGFVINNLD